MKSDVAVKITEPSLSVEDPIVVVCGADNTYAMPLAVTIRSAVENLNSDRKLIWYVIDGGITPGNKRRILKSMPQSLLGNQLEIRWVRRPDVFSDEVVLSDHLPSLQDLPNATFYKLLIPDVLPKEFKKAIYMDCDVIVNESLTKLWDIEMGDNYLLSRVNSCVPSVSHPDGLLDWEQLGFRPDDKKFAAGVLVFNLDKWRADDLCAKALNYLANNKQYIRWHESDVLHAVVVRQWGIIDSQWNAYKGITMSEAELKDAFIVHYMSMAKPWVVKEKSPASDWYFRYLRMTDWSGYNHTAPQRLWRRLKREVKKLRSKFR
jgi:lipopolysaccharide biosynthesis glycosyltransferase